VNSFSQRLYSDKLLITTTINSGKKYNDYTVNVARRERIIGGTIFGTLLFFFVKGAINVYKLNKN
jgi:hypothetical protein